MRTLFTITDLLYHHVEFCQSVLHISQYNLLYFICTIFNKVKKDTPNYLEVSSILIHIFILELINRHRPRKIKPLSHMTPILS